MSTTPELAKHGAEISILKRLSIWEGLIVAAALQRGCTVLYSEDLNHGQRIRGVEVRNPFH